MAGVAREKLRINDPVKYNKLLQDEKRMRLKEVSTPVRWTDYYFYTGNREKYYRACEEAEYSKYSELISALEIEIDKFLESIDNKYLWVYYRYDIYSGRDSNDYLFDIIKYFGKLLRIINNHKDKIEKALILCDERIERLIKLNRESELAEVQTKKEELTKMLELFNGKTTEEKTPEEYKKNSPKSVLKFIYDRFISKVKPNIRDLRDRDKNDKSTKDQRAHKEYYEGFIYFIKNAMKKLNYSPIDPIYDANLSEYEKNQLIKLFTESAFSSNDTDSFYVTDTLSDKVLSTYLSGGYKKRTKSRKSRKNNKKSRKNNKKSRKNNKKSTKSKSKY